MNAATSQQWWHYRRVDLSAFAGKVVSGIGLIIDGNSSAGLREIFYQDIALVSGDGTVRPIYSRQKSITLEILGTGGVSGRGYEVNHVSGAGQWPQVTTMYYHGDHLGSSRVMTAYEGYPTWSATFLPFGQEHNPQPTTNHYKFTGKERDAESGLDNFVARMHGSSMGRFLSPDPGQESGFLYMDDPQAWNGYSYSRNNPLIFTDPSGRVYEYCTQDEDGNYTQCNQVSDKQHAAAVKEGVNTFKDGKIFDGETQIGTYKQIDVDLPGDPEANRQAAGMIAATFDSAMTEFGKNAAYAATGTVVLRGLGALASAATNLRIFQNIKVIVNAQHAFRAGHVSVSPARATVAVETAIQAGRYRNVLEGTNQLIRGEVSVDGVRIGFKGRFVDGVARVNVFDIK